MNDLAIVNKEAALERLDSDEELYAEVLEVFFEDTPVQLEKLNNALSSNMINEVMRISHSLKSASANIGAERLSAVSKKTELASKNGSLSELPDLLREIQREFDAVVNLLK